MDTKAGSEKFLQGLLRVPKADDDRGLSNSVRRGLSLIPDEGLFRLPESNPELLSSEKVLLTRKANELYRLGQFQAAEKIYLTVGYSAGLHKLAEHYFQKNNFVQAYLLFQAANDYKNADVLAERFVSVLRKWLKNNS